MINQTFSNEYDDFVHTLFNVTGDHSKDFAHAVLGIATEAYEFSEATDLCHAKEESGDFLFFCVAACQTLKRAFPALCEAVQSSVEQSALISKEIDAFLQMTAVQANRSFRTDLTLLQDASKRWVGYGKEPEEKLIGPILLVLGVAILKLLYVHPRSMLQMRATLIDPLEFIQSSVSANMAKLSTRYKNAKFTAEEALNRDLAAEREALETALG